MEVMESSIVAVASHATIDIAVGMPSVATGHLYPYDGPSQNTLPPAPVGIVGHAPEQERRPELRQGIEPAPRPEGDAPPNGSKPDLPSLAASKKRKSESSDGSTGKGRASSSSMTTASRDSSVEYNPTATHTRSGRQTHRPVSLTMPAPHAVASPSKKVARSQSNATGAATSPSTAKSHPGIKRRVYRGREQFALCEHCQRGHGPPGNVIVFCDACNKCWHQRCHDPQVPKQAVVDSKAEWYCAACDKILHGSKKSKKPAAPADAAPPAAPAAALAKASPVYSGLRVGGRHLTDQQKKAYLHTLSREGLVALLLQSSELAPDLPLFETLVPPVSAPQPQFTSAYVTPVSEPYRRAESDAGHDGHVVDEGYDGYFDDNAALYPHPGNGIKLPAEREDLHMLLEGKESRTFSHWVRGVPGPVFRGTGNVLQ